LRSWKRIVFARFPWRRGTVPRSHCSAHCFSDNDMHRATTGLTDDPKPWRDRAHEARIRAGELNDPEAKRQMLGIARGYDRLARAC
jgi:hypothetical protein